MKDKFCLKCGVKISKWGKIRCRKCATKENATKRNFFGKNNPNYKDGRWLIKHYCKDCGIEVGVYSKQCKPCFRKNPPFRVEKKKCIDCGEELPNQQDAIRCKKCHFVFYRGENHPKWIKRPYCVECGIKLKTLDSKRCYRCANKGELNPVWGGGTSFEPYPREWNKEFKASIRFRDNYKCQICGVPEMECERKLSIHHIDGDKNNLSLNNLISLCYCCHGRTNKKREDWKKISKFTRLGKISI